MADEWTWDDPATVRSEWRLARRVPRRFLVPSGEAEVGVNPAAFGLMPEAFQYDHRDAQPDQVGCSVSCVEMYRGSGVDTAQLVDWGTHVVAVIPVAMARTESSGVVHRPVGDDASHCLIRVEGTSRRDRREQWLPLRSLLVRACEVIISPAAAHEYDRSAN